MNFQTKKLLCQQIIVINKYIYFNADKHQQLVDETFDEQPILTNIENSP